MGTAYVASMQGENVVKNLHATISQKKDLEPFTFHYMAAIVSLGKRIAAMNLLIGPVKPGMLKFLSFIFSKVKADGKGLYLQGKIFNMKYSFKKKVYVFWENLIILCNSKLSDKMPFQGNSLVSSTVYEIQYIYTLKSYLLISYLIYSVRYE